MLGGSIVLDDKLSISELKKKVEKELIEREVNELEYWKTELEKLFQKKVESLGSLQLGIKNLIERMENRIKVLKKGIEF